MANHKKYPDQRKAEAALTKWRIRRLGMKPEDGPMLRDILGIMDRRGIDERIKQPLQDNATEETESGAGEVLDL